MKKANKNYKYRARLTPEQIEQLDKWQLSVWEMMRWAVKQRRWAEHQRRHALTAFNLSSAIIGISIPEGMFEEPWISKPSQSRELTHKRNDNEYWKAVPRTCCTYALDRVEQGSKKVVEERKKGNFDAMLRYPRNYTDVSLTFQVQKEQQEGLEPRQVSRKYGAIKVPSAGNLGEVQFRYHRLLPEDAVIKMVTLKREADGWYIVLACEFEAPAPLPATGKTIGVDLNCQHYGDKQAVAALSDGRTYTQDDELKRLQKKLAHLQRLVSPKRKVSPNARAADPNSNRTKRRQRRIARIHQRIARKRAEKQRFIAKRIAGTADTVGFENVNWHGLRRAKKKDGTQHKRGGRRLKRNINKSMSTAAPGQLRQFTREKCNEYGRQYREVNAAYTSQVCSACGCKPDKKKDLSVRSWTCPDCGTHHDRDTNAARNIAKLAEDKSAPVCNGEETGEGERSASSSVNLETSNGTEREDGKPPDVRHNQRQEDR